VGSNTTAGHNATLGAVGSAVGQDGVRVPCRLRNATNATEAVMPPPTPPLHPPPLSNATNATDAAALLNATNATRPLNASASSATDDAPMEGDGASGAPDGAATERDPLSHLPFCDELEGSNTSSAVQSEGVEAATNATDGATDGGQAVEYCAVEPESPRTEATYAEVCGLMLHHGATVIRDGEGGDARTTLLRLTNGSGSMGAAWFASPLPLASGFDSTFTMQMLDPGSPDGRRSPVSGGGIALVLQSDRRGHFASGCAGGGLGFRADTDASARCSERVTRAVAIAFLADRAQVIRTDTDFVVPMAEGYYPWPLRIDDGKPHTMRVRHLTPGGDALGVYVDDLEWPLLSVSGLSLRANALDASGLGIVGLTASSGAAAVGEATVEVHDWRLAPSDVAARSHHSVHLWEQQDDLATDSTESPSGVDDAGVA
jgi:hypothetical protein